MMMSQQFVPGYIGNFPTSDAVRTDLNRLFYSEMRPTDALHADLPILNYNAQAWVPGTTGQHQWPSFGFQTPLTSQWQTPFTSSLPGYYPTVSPWHHSMHSQLTNIPVLDPRVNADPRFALDPRLGIDPRLSLDPRYAIDPRFALDPRLGIDPRLSLDPRHAIDPRISYDPRWAVDPRLGWEPRIGLDPRFYADPRQLDPRFTTDARSTWTTPSSHLYSSMSPAVNCAETPDAHLIVVELPGVDVRDVSVQVAGNQLILTAFRKPIWNNGTVTVGYHTTEGRFGTLRRVFQLPLGYPANQIQANLVNGQITIVLPKAALPVGVPTQTAANVAINSAIPTV